MSALPVPSSPAAPAPDLSRFVPIERAVELLEKDDGNIRRHCRDRLAPRGLAVLAPSPETGKPTWHLSREADPRLIGGPIGPLHKEPDLAGFTLHQQLAARQRRECVLSFRLARSAAAGPVADWLPGLIAELREKFPALRVSRSHLYRWDQAYVRPADLVELVDGRGGNRRGHDSAEAWDAFKDLYCDDKRRTLRSCWEAVAALAAENGWTWCSRKSCYAQLDARIPPQLRTATRTPARYRKQLQPTIAQDPEAWPAGERWVSDHKQLDLWCRFGETLLRPWLTTWQDWRTRRICGWVLSDQPNSHTIRAALHHGLADPRNFGGPAEVLTDNGKDYDAWTFHGQTKSQRKGRIHVDPDARSTAGIFNLLGIEAHFSQPYNPNSKSRMERWFRTLSEFCKCFPTYAGESVETRPENLNRILQAPGQVPTFATVRDRLATHITGYNADADHGRLDVVEDGVKLSPDEAMARWCRRHRTLADPAALELLLAQHHKPATVGRNGIALALAGASVSYGQFEEALSPYKALRKQDRKPLVVTYDPHDLRSIRVYDPAGGRLRFICAAPMNGTGGVDTADPIGQQDLAELSKRKAQYNRAQRHVAEHGITTVRTKQERLAGIASERRPALRATGTDGGAEAPAIRIVQTPADGEAKHVRRAEVRESMRPATAATQGAESPGVAAGAGSVADRLLALGRREREARAARAAADRPVGYADWTALRPRRDGDGR